MNVDRGIKRCAGCSSALSILTLAILAAVAVLTSSCHQMIPLAPDYNGYAPTLAPPLTQRLPGVGTSVGSLAPNFKLINLNNKEIELSDFRGKPVLLNFWTYCSECKEELPYIQNVYENRGTIAPDLMVIAINVTQQSEQVMEFVEHYGLTFEFLLDTWATTASDYYIHQIPTTFFVDKNGIIMDVQAGAFSGTEVIKQRVISLAKR
jgi:peroxiredoxin